MGRDNLLLTPVSEGDFAGAPYPQPVAACAACLEAALGLGAPHLVHATEQALLTQAWRCWLAAS